MRVTSSCSSRLALALLARLALALLPLGAVVLAPATAAGAQKRPGGGELAAHRAVYEFTLAGTRPSKSVTQLSGRMVYEFIGSKCDGFTQSMRFVTISSGKTGETAVTDQRSLTWENPAATTMRFQSSQFRERKLIDQTAGTAKRGGAGEDIAIELTRPEEGTTAIGNGALFPIQHTMKLLELARAGARHFTAPYYDGGEGGEKGYRVTAFIGRRKAPGNNRALPRVGETAKLDGVAAWPVSLGYFDHGAHKSDAVPVYEMSFLLYENGVSRRLMIDNGDYSIKGRLTKLEMLEPMPCRQ